jgi:DNA gyrase/topoisomerase IV subunit A
VDRIPDAHDPAPHDAPAREGARAHPCARRAADRAAEHRRGDPHHPCADEPKPALIERFALSERQAEDILEIRLRQLARLEAIRIEQELKELRVEAAKLDEILKSPAILKRTMIKEIEADAKAHGDERRTLILEQKRTVVEIKVPDEPVTVVVSLKGWVRALKGHEIEPASLGFKAGDGLYGTFACRSVDNLLVFGTQAAASAGSTRRRSRSCRADAATASRSRA